MGKHTATSLFTTGELSGVRTEPGSSSILNSQHTASWSFYCKEAYHLRWKTWLEFRSRKVLLLQRLEAENSEVVLSHPNCRANNWLRPWSNAKHVETAPKKSPEVSWHPPSFQAISFIVGNNRLQQRKQQNLHNLWPRPSHQLQSKHEQCYHSNKCTSKNFAPQMQRNQFKHVQSFKLSVSLRFQWSSIFHPNHCASFNYTFP